METMDLGGEGCVKGGASRKTNVPPRFWMLMVGEDLPEDGGRD